MVRMSLYICLVVMALLAPAAESLKCVFPDQYEVTLQKYYQSIYYNVSSSNTGRLQSITKYSLDRNYNSIVSERIVTEYNLMIQFVIPVNGACTLSKLYADINRGIPDYAEKVDQFPLRLPPDLPEGIEYWGYTWINSKYLIIGVLNVSPNVCTTVVWGPFDENHEIITEEVSYIWGDYSLSIRNMSVFDVPPKCTQ